MIFGDLYTTEQEIYPMKNYSFYESLCITLVFLIISINTLVIYFSYSFTIDS